MQKIFLLALIFSSTYGLFSCSDGDEDSEKTEETFIFGIFNGFCIGNCAHLFLFTDGEVFRDEIDKFELDSLVFSDIAAPNLTSVAENLLNNFPSILEESTTDTYGCPGCVDQGTLFLQQRDDDMVRSWFIDPMPQEDWPQELTEFVGLLKEDLNKIIIL